MHAWYNNKERKKRQNPYLCRRSVYSYSHWLMTFFNFLLIYQLGTQSEDLFHHIVVCFPIEFSSLDLLANKIFYRFMDAYLILIITGGWNERKQTRMKWWASEHTWRKQMFIKGRVILVLERDLTCLFVFYKFNTINILIQSEMYVCTICHF